MKDSPLSPIDDRYYEEVRELTPFFSQESLVQERARIELEYLSFLMRVGVAPSSKIPAIEVSYEEVKGLEADLGHDVKWYQAGHWKHRFPTGIDALLKTPARDPRRRTLAKASAVALSILAIVAAFTWAWAVR